MNDCSTNGLDQLFARLNSDELTEAIRRLPTAHSVALPCLDKTERQKLISIVDTLAYRPAQTVTGSSTTPVYQDFELCYHIPEDHPLWVLASQLEKQVIKAIKKAKLQGYEVLHFNDLIVQRYSPGCRGITPHRDQARYRIVVAILLLSGDGNFQTCANRGGENATTIPATAGDLLLMSAPGLAEKQSGPLHFVNGVTRRRRTIGLRYDAHATANEDFQKA